MNRLSPWGAVCRCGYARFYPAYCKCGFPNNVALQAGAVTPDGSRQAEVGPPSVSGFGNLGAGPQ